MREISPAFGRLILAALHFVPSRLAWPQYGRIGLDPQGCTHVHVRGRGSVVWWEHA